MTANEKIPKLDESAKVTTIKKLDYDIIANSLYGGLTYSYMFYRKNLDEKCFEELHNALNNLHQAAHEWLLIVKKNIKNGDLSSLSQPIQQ